MGDLLKSDREPVKLRLGTYQIIQILNAYGIPFKSELLISEGDESSCRELKAQRKVDVRTNLARDALTDVLAELDDVDAESIIKEICDLILPKEGEPYCINTQDGSDITQEDSVVLKIAALLYDLLLGTKRKPKSQIRLAEAILEAAKNLDKINDKDAIKELVYHLYSFEPLWIEPVCDRPRPIYDSNGELVNYDTTPQAVATYVYKALLDIIPSLLLKPDDRNKVDSDLLFIPNQVLIGVSNLVNNSEAWRINVNYPDGRAEAKTIKDFFKEILATLEQFLIQQENFNDKPPDIASLCRKFRQGQLQFTLDIVKHGEEVARQNLERRITEDGRAEEVERVPKAIVKSTN